MVRVPCCDQKLGLRKGTWTAEEDHILKSFVHRYGHGNWRTLPKRAAKLPGRTDNEIKNVWYTHLKKRLRNNISADAELDSKDRPSAEISPNNLGSEASVQKHNYLNEQDVNHCDKGRRPTLMESTSSFTSSQEESDGDFSSVASNWYNNNLAETQNMDMYHDFNKYDDLSDNIIMPEFYYDTYWSEGPFINMEAAAAPGEPQDEDDLWMYETYSNYGIDIWS
ncbi:hypothetical protein H6P81_000745 [Aristolochia fimbriata]|uniref:Uncharacterized protein n=1 Tax=Aristolochia fimbriata TaxID=158543 RepID=A0AAV7F8B8_ARIFI|nr:hypothetical protein H6P81_000745 [Aristolochia fimbriata]